MTRHPGVQLLRFLLWLALVVAIIVAVIYLIRSRGWGISDGGRSDRSGSGSVRALLSPPGRCAIVVAAEGITVDGAKRTRVEAVAACKTTAGAEVTVTGDARQGDWDELRRALHAGGIEIFKREPKGSGRSGAKP